MSPLRETLGILEPLQHGHALLEHDRVTVVAVVGAVEQAGGTLVAAGGSCLARGLDQLVVLEDAHDAQLAQLGHRLEHLVERRADDVAQAIHAAGLAQRIEEGGHVGGDGAQVDRGVVGAHVELVVVRDDRAQALDLVQAARRLEAEAARVEDHFGERGVRLVAPLVVAVEEGERTAVPAEDLVDLVLGVVAQRLLDLLLGHLARLDQQLADRTILLLLLHEQDLDVLAGHLAAANEDLAEAQGPGGPREEDADALGREVDLLHHPVPTQHEHAGLTVCIQRLEDIEKCDVC